MLPDSTIGPYRIVRRLGQGGMGEVALAYDSRLKRHVALKSLLPGDDEPDARPRLIREARAAAGLSHQGIAAIFDIVEDADRPFIVMEYVEGETLRARLTERLLSIPEALGLAEQLCAALAEAHKHGVIHRDLKPTNIMLTSNGGLKILDFGLARHLPSVSPTDLTTEASVIAPGLVGTVGYIAPEQMSGGVIDQRCDIFSLGAVLFEMFTGARPFDTRDGLTYALAVTSKDAPRADAVNSRVSSPLASVLARTLARNPADRYGSVIDLATALRAAADRALTTTTPIPVPPPAGWTWQTPAVAAVVVLSLVVLGAVAIVMRSTSVVPSASGSTVLAVLPVNSAGTDDATVTIGAGISAILSANLSRVTAINVVPVNGALPGSSAEMTATLRRLDARWALETAIRQASERIVMHVALRARDTPDTVAWEADYSGNPLTVQRRVLDGLATGLVRAGVVRGLTPSERDGLLASPTADNDAFVAYSSGRIRLAALTDPTAPDAALTFFQSAIERDPRFALAYAGVSDAYWVQYQRTKNAALVDKASEAARQAIALDPAQAAVQLSLATMWNQTGRSNDALAAVDRAIALQPNNDDAYRLRGRILSQSGKIDDALKDLDRAIELRPNYVAHHETKGFILYRAARYQEAAAVYRRVTELAPEYPTGYQMLGTSLHQLGDITQAIGNYEHAVRLGPSATAYSNLAYSYYEAGRLNDALEAYQESIKRDPNRPAAHRNIGDVYTRLGKEVEARRSYESAVAVATRMLAVNPSDAITIALVALCEAKLGRSVQAEGHAAEALALRPREIEVVVRNAEVYAILRQPDSALRYLHSAVSLGYEPSQARQNDELKTLRQDPRFTSAIAAPPK